MFIGLVLGSLPSYIGEANRKGFRAGYVVFSVVTLAAVVALGILAARGPLPSAGQPIGIPDSVVYGGILGAGTVIPGISASFVYMYLGVFDEILAALSNVDLTILASMGVGFAVTALALLRLAEWLFRRFHGPAYYSVLGFLLGSMAMVFPGFRDGWLLAADLALLAGAIAASAMLMRLNKGGGRTAEEPVC